MQTLTVQYTRHMSARIATAVLALLLAPTLPACAGKKGEAERPNEWEAAEPEGDMMSAFDEDEPPEDEEEDGGDAPEGEGDAAEGEEPAAPAAAEGEAPATDG